MPTLSYWPRAFMHDSDSVLLVGVDAGGTTSRWLSGWSIDRTEMHLSGSINPASVGSAAALATFEHILSTWILPKGRAVERPTELRMVVASAGLGVFGVPAFATAVEALLTDQFQTVDCLLLNDVLPLVLHPLSPG